MTSSQQEGEANLKKYFNILSEKNEDGEDLLDIDQLPVVIRAFALPLSDEEEENMIEELLEKNMTKINQEKQESTLKEKLDKEDPKNKLIRWFAYFEADPSNPTGLISKDDFRLILVETGDDCWDDIKFDENYSKMGITPIAPDPNNPNANNGVEMIDYKQLCGQVIERTNEKKGN